MDYFFLCVTVFFGELCFWLEESRDLFTSLYSKTKVFERRKHKTLQGKEFK